jgi:hypothetical protein
MINLVVDPDRSEISLWTEDQRLMKTATELDLKYKKDSTVHPNAELSLRSLSH